VTEDAWATLADPFVEGAYASVKGRVRTFVLHQQLLRHLPEPPASVLDVGGGAAHQSLPLARLGYEVTLLDPSAAMLAKAQARVADEPDQVRRRYD
jgi:S-adenosylmethionine-dependent methyltransferase